MKTILLLSILVGGHVEITAIPTESEPICLFVEREMHKAAELPTSNPAAPRVVGAECADSIPAEAVAVPSAELPL